MTLEDKVEYSKALITISELGQKYKLDDRNIIHPEITTFLSKLIQLIEKDHHCPNCKKRFNLYDLTKQESGTK